MLVSKDINLRIKAAVLGVHAEDYYSDKTLEDSDVLYTGMTALPANFWESHGKDMRSWKEGERTFYEVSGPAVHEWQPNQCVYEDSPQGIEAIVRKMDGEQRDPRARCATIATSGTACGASRRAIANRISR